MVVGAGGVGPEFDKAARHMERAGDAALFFEFADVAHIDDEGVVVAGQGDGLGRCQGLDLGAGRCDQLFGGLL